MTGRYRKPPLDPRPSFIERGSTVRVRQRASAFSLLSIAFVFRADADRLFWRPPSVHQRPPVGAGRVQCVEELDRVLASVAGEVAVMAVDHRQASPHVARELEGDRKSTRLN